MMHAIEALTTLPGARLSPSDAEATAQHLAQLDAHVRENMTRTGCIMPIDPSKMNPNIAVEIERTCRQRGWRAEFQQVAVKSALAPGQKTAHFQLALAPTDESYAEADKAMREATEN